MTDETQKLKILSLFGQNCQFYQNFDQNSKFWLFGKILIRFWSKIWGQGQIFGPRVKIWGPIDFGTIWILGPGPRPDPNHSGLRSKFPKKPGYGWRSLTGPTRVRQPPGPKLTKLVKILTFWSKFCQILKNFHSEILMILVILKFWVGTSTGPGWPLDASAPLSRYFRLCGQRAGGRKFWILTIFDILTFRDFEISEIWLKFSIITFGCEELSREGSAQGPGQFSGFWPFWAILTFLTDDLSPFDQILVILVILVDFGSVQGVREGLARWWRDPQRAAQEPGRVWGGGQGPGREGSVDFGHLDSGVKIWGPGQILVQGRGFWSQGQNLRSGSIWSIFRGFWGFWFWAVLGHFGTQPESAKRVQNSGTSQKTGSMPGDQDLDRRVNFGVKNLTMRFHRLRSDFGHLGHFKIWTILGRFWGRSGVRRV